MFYYCIQSKIVLLVIVLILFQKILRFCRHHFPECPNQVSIASSRSPSVLAKLYLPLCNNSKIMNLLTISELILAKDFLFH